MGRRRSSIVKIILGRQRAAEEARALDRTRLIEAGPPAGSMISRQAWRDWHEYGFVVCPRQKTTCTDPACGIGASCLAMRAISSAGDGSPLKHKDRPECGARNRQGQPCAVRVEACRAHGAHHSTTRIYPRGPTDNGQPLFVDEPTCPLEAVAAAVPAAAVPETFPLRSLSARHEFERYDVRGAS